MTLEKLNQIVFVPNAQDFTIEQTTYRDYLSDYGSDETTSPRGVEPRIHIREVEVDEYEEDEYLGTSTVFQVWTWGTNGNHPRNLTQFDTEEEAILHIAECRENYISNHNWDAPCVFDTRDEAIKNIADALEKPFESVKRLVEYLDKKSIQAKIEAEAHRKNYAEQKNKINEAVTVEAETIVIDEIFKVEALAARRLTGNEKSQAQSKAFTSLLKRQGVEAIKSDFWEVFRIVNAKIK